MAKLDTIASKRPKSGSGSLRLCSTTRTLRSPWNRWRAAASIGGEKSSATASASGRSIRSSASNRPSPVPRSRIRRASRGTRSSTTASPSVRCGTWSARAKYFNACSAVAYSLRIAPRVMARCSVLPVWQLRRGLRLLENAFLHLNALGQFFLRHDRINSVKQLPANQRIAFHGAVQFAGRHRDKRVANAVDRYNQNVFARFDAGFFNRLDRADRHVIIVRKQHGDFLCVGVLEE